MSTTIWKVPDLDAPMVDQRDRWRRIAERLETYLDTERRRTAYWKGRARKLAAEIARMEEKA